jgi:regulator of sigma E protease
VASTPIEAGDELVSYAGKSVRVPQEVFIYTHDTQGAPAEVRFRRNGELLSTILTPEYTPGKRYILGFNGAQAYGPDWNLIGQVTEGEPADLLGLEPGDRIMTVSGQTPANREELRNILAQSGGGEVEVTWIKADGTPASGMAAPKMTDNQDSYSIGIAYKAVEKPSIFDGIRYAYHISVSYAKMVLYSLKWMVTGVVGLNQVSGPVGIVAEIGAGVEETSRSPYGMRAVISFLFNLSALIGINLGLFNLIPFPPLDGSKLLLLGIEAVRRKDIPIERQIAISMFGFIVLILVMALTFFNDIFKLISK